jgi:hypothetical protein
MTSFLGAVTNYFWPSTRQDPMNAESSVLLHEEGDAVVVDLCDEKKQKTAEVATRMLSQSPASIVGQPPKDNKKKSEGTSRKVTHNDLFEIGKNAQRKQEKKKWK